VHDRDDAVERGVDVDAYVEDVAAAGERLRRTWRVLADGFAAVCRARVPDVARR
jgi:GMP synthase (glutamine-hydrolysing)